MEIEIEKHQYSKAKSLWKMREAKANSDEYCDQSSQPQIESRVSVRHEMWEKHMHSPALALDEPLRRTAAGGGRAESTTAGGSTA